MRLIGKVNLAAQLCSQFAKIWQVVQSTKSSLIIVGTSSGPGNGSKILGQEYCGGFAMQLFSFWHKSQQKTQL